jgi:hypothetical protein
MHEFGSVSLARTEATPNLLPKYISPHWAYRHQLFDLFVTSYVPVILPHAHPFDKDRFWMTEVQELPSWTKALEAALLTLSTSRLGRLNDDRVLSRESLKWYSIGLVELQKALWDPTLMRRDETLAACFALTWYELTECVSESIVGYLSHHHGCAKLIQLRGPDAHRSGLAHYIFTAFRVQGVSWLRLR